MAAVDIDLSAFEADLNNYINNLLPNGLKNGMERACIAVEGQAKENCPVDEGILRASLTHDTEIKDSKINGYVGSGLEYAVYVHQGTGLYAVNGDGRKDVPWTYRDKDGKLVTTVGSKPNPFLQKSIDKLHDKIPQLIKEGLRG